MKSRHLSTVLAVFACLADAHAQNTFNFNVDITSPLAPVATWTTSPPAASCEAGGDWFGAFGAEGSETLPPIRSSVSYSLTCEWAGDAIATLTWVEATQNEDGSAYDDPQSVRLAWSPNEDLPGAFDCLAPDADPAVEWTDRPAGQTMHTVTGLNPGAWQFAAYSVSSMGLCSTPSNVESKTITGSVTMSDTISITVPGAVVLIAAE